MDRGEPCFFPKLYEKHSYPSPWDKMSTSVAAQTLSSTVGHALQQQGYLALSKFVLTMDKWFDSVNAGFQNKHFKDARSPDTDCGDERLCWLQSDFLSYLNLWEQQAYARPLVGSVNRDKMLLSKATWHGLKACTLSMVALIKETLLAGAEYVLPRRINQDPLESYFRDRGAIARRTQLWVCSCPMLGVSIY